MRVGDQYEWRHGSVVEVYNIVDDEVHAVVVKPGIWRDSELREHVVYPRMARFIFSGKIKEALGDPIN